MYRIKDCKTCMNYIYDDAFGRYMCTKYNHRIRDLDRYIDCPGHKEKEEPHER